MEIAPNTAPANGWFFFQKVAGKTSTFLTLINNTLYTFGSESKAVTTLDWLKCIVPVRKGDVVVAEYNVTGVTKDFKFFYAIGSEQD